MKEPPFLCDHADLVHRSSPKVTVSVAEVKKLVPYLHSKDQVC